MNDFNHLDENLAVAQPVPTGEPPDPIPSHENCASKWWHCVVSCFVRPWCCWCFGNTTSARHFVNYDDESLWQTAVIADPQQQQHQDQQQCQYVYDLISEGLPCCDVIGVSTNSGIIRRKDCRYICECLESSSSSSWETFRDETRGQSILHKAAFQRSCVHVLIKIIERNITLLFQPDRTFELPIHSFLRGRRHLSETETHAILDVLLYLPTTPEPNAHDVQLGHFFFLHAACRASETFLNDTIVRRISQVIPESRSELDDYGRTPLHCHCMRRTASLEMAQLLYNDGSHGYGADIYGLTPLHYAAKNANLDLARFLIFKDPSQARMRIPGSLQNPLHLVLMSYQSYHGDSPSYISCIRDLVEAGGAEVVCHQDCDANTPLHLLLSHPRRPATLDVVQTIVTANSACLNIANGDEYLPLHYAVMNSDPEVIQFLLSVCSETACAVTRKHDTALSLACSRNMHFEVVERLLEMNRQATHTRNDYGFLPIHCVCRAHRPQSSIVKVLVQHYPESIHQMTNAGETPAHLASLASMAVLELLTSSTINHAQPRVFVNKIGNTPLHEQCFRYACSDSIEAMAASNPGWITALNHAGYSPLQILCRNSGFNEHIIQCFFQLRGPEIFCRTDSAGNTPLHSAMRSGTSVESLRALVKVCPLALQMRTEYRDTPLHLACLRRIDVALVSEVVRAIYADHKHTGCCPLFERNLAGQTPFSIAMDSFREILLEPASYETTRAHENASQLLYEFIRMIHYGVNHRGNECLLGPALVLHRQDARLIPEFVHHVLATFPEEARILDSQGNYPLHLEAMIPMEKLVLLNEGCTTRSVGRHGVLADLFEAFPDAAKHINHNGETVLSLMVSSGRPFDQTMGRIILLNPTAVSCINLSAKLTPHLLATVGNHCGASCLFSVIRSRPGILYER